MPTMCAKPWLKEHQKGLSAPLLSLTGRDAHDVREAVVEGVPEGVVGAAVLSEVAQPGEAGKVVGEVERVLVVAAAGTAGNKGQRQRESGATR